MNTKEILEEAKKEESHVILQDFDIAIKKHEDDGNEGFYIKLMSPLSKYLLGKAVRCDDCMKLRDFIFDILYEGYSVFIRDANATFRPTKDDRTATPEIIMSIFSNSTRINVSDDMNARVLATLNYTKDGLVIKFSDFVIKAKKEEDTVYIDSVDNEENYDIILNEGLKDFVYFTITMGRNVDIEKVITILYTPHKLGHGLVDVEASEGSVYNMNMIFSD